jgi:hypothetical protein
MTKPLTDVEIERLRGLSRRDADRLIGWMINAGSERPGVGSEIRAFLRCHPDAGCIIMDAPEADRSDSP